LNKLIGTTLPIFLASALITVVTTLTFFLFIETSEAEMKGISSSKEIEESFFSKATKDNDILNQSTAIIVNQEKKYIK
jgi:preprotein translocase subunit SecG